MNHYDISSAQLFTIMYNDSHPFGLGVLNHKPDKLTPYDAQLILEKHKYYIDYHNGIAIKNSFRQQINIQKYDDRNNVKFIYKLLKFMVTKL
jgi:hypothetical protein